MYGWFACLYVCLASSTCLVPGEVKNGYQISWKLPYGYWNRTLDALEEQPLLLAAEPSLQLFSSFN